MNIVQTVILASFYLVVTPFIAHAEKSPFQWPSSYTMEYEQQAPGGSFKNIYRVSDHKARNEATSLKNNKTTVTVFDFDSMSMFAYDTTDTTYKETPIKKQFTFNAVSHMFDTEGAWQKVATEDINGVAADKYTVTTDKNPGKPTYVWISQQTHEPVKVANADNTRVMAISKFTVGAVEASQFTVPAGFHKFDETDAFQAWQSNQHP